MGLDIYISRKTASGKECLIHWHKFAPVAKWFKEKVYNGALDCDERPLDYLALVFLHENCVAALDSENWKEKMQEQLFQVKPDFVWTGRRELAYLKMMETIAEDIENVAEPGPGEELRIQISY